MENVISLLGMQPGEKYLITGPYFWHFLLKIVKLRKDSILLREENLDFEILLVIFFLLHFRVGISKFMQFAHLPLKTNKQKNEPQIKQTLEL